MSMIRNILFVFTHGSFLNILVAYAQLSMTIRFLYQNRIKIVYIMTQKYFGIWIFLMS